MNWLECATQFYLGRETFIEARDQRDGSKLWIVKRYGGVLNSDGNWEVEPISSSRDDDYIRRTRLPSKEAALERLKVFGGWNK